MFITYEVVIKYCSHIACFYIGKCYFRVIYFRYSEEAEDKELLEKEREKQEIYQQKKQPDFPKLNHLSYWV